MKESNGEDSHEVRMAFISRHIESREPDGFCISRFVSQKLFLTTPRIINNSNNNTKSQRKTYLNKVAVEWTSTDIASKFLVSHINPYPENRPSFMSSGQLTFWSNVLWSAETMDDDWPTTMDYRTMEWLWLSTISAWHKPDDGGNTLLVRRRKSMDRSSGGWLPQYTKDGSGDCFHYGR